ncbi:hypothetical protein COOONC_11729 [Cooperia oncophora]
MEASKRLRFDVIALQETKAKETATRKTNDGHLIVLGAKLSGRNVGGVGFLVHHRLEHMVDSVEVIGPRLAILRLRIDKRTFVSIINCYAPTSTATDEEKDAFYKELEEMIKRERSYYKYVVGDFNAVIHEEMPATARIGPHGTGETNENGERLMDLLEQCNLFHGNSFFTKKEDRRWTRTSTLRYGIGYHNKDGFEGRIDDKARALLQQRAVVHRNPASTPLERAVINKGCRIAVKDLKRCRRDINDSRSVTTVMRDAMGRPQTSRARIEEIAVNFYTDLYRSTMPVPRIPTPTQDAAPQIEEWEDFDIASWHRLPPRTDSNGRIDDKARALLQQRAVVHRNPASTPLERAVINKGCRIAVKDLKRCRRDINDSRSVTTVMRDAMGRPQTSRARIEEIAVNFYTDLYRSTMPVPRIPTPTQDAAPQIEEWEVHGRARNPGPVEDVTVLLFKKGERDLMKNYRPIALLSQPYKLFTKVILNRLEEQLDDCASAHSLRMTEVMRSEWADASPITLEGTALPDTDRYVYLGRLISMDNNLREEIMRRKKCAWTAMGRIREAAQLISVRKIRAALQYCLPL